MQQSYSNKTKCKLESDH